MLGKNHQSGYYSNSKKEGEIDFREFYHLNVMDSVADIVEGDYVGTEVRGGNVSGEMIGRIPTHMNDNLQIARALQMQMEVHKKLLEQIEVQRHLQLRIEAQGKYLQSVLEKAQETLAGCNSSCMGLEAAKAELSHLVSMVERQRPSSSFSGLTERGGFSLLEAEKQPVSGVDCSMTSLLTISESCEEKPQKQEDGYPDECKKHSDMHPFMEINPNRGNSNDRIGGRKRSGTISDGNSVDQQSAKRSPTHKKDSDNQFRNSGSTDELELNNQYQREMKLGFEELDLNSRREELGYESSKNFSS